MTLLLAYTVVFEYRASENSVCQRSFDQYLIISLLMSAVTAIVESPYNLSLPFSEMAL